MKLTEPQRRHLRELIKPNGKILFWSPYGIEHRVVQALCRKGLLTAALGGGYGLTYELTEEGERIARGLADSLSDGAEGGG